MSSNTAYPWFFFYRIARLTLVIFLPTLFLILFLYRSSYRSGMVSETQNHMRSELEILKKTLQTAGLSWERWCKSFPPGEEKFLVKTKKEMVLCGPLIKEGEVLSVEITDEDLIIQKILPLSIFKENMEEFDRVLFLRIVPFALISYFIFIFLFYLSTRPLGIILSKVEKFKEDIPFSKSLDLLYKKDEWAGIEEALNKADQKLQLQVEEAKLENERTSAILEAISDAIIAVDRFESVLFFNNKMKNNFLRNREGQEIDKKLWHIFSDDVLSAFQSVLKTGEPQALKGKSFPESHIPDRFFDLSLTPLKDLNGTVTGALGVFYDVTDFKLTEQMRVDFVANVSHEIRTPLTSIKGFTQILQSQSLKVDEELRPFLDKIITNTERMISLFNDLLNLSVIESQNSLTIEEFSLLDVVESVEANIVASYPHKKVEFEHDLELEYIKGDYRLVEQVLLNLSDNACKYSSEYVKITLSSFKKNEKAYVCIQDNGPGISKEHLPRIFERFYRVEASRESLRGTGLGLAIVKQIISKHRGKIWAESEGLGTGTKFVIELPS